MRWSICNVLANQLPSPELRASRALFFVVLLALWAHHVPFVRAQEAEGSTPRVSGEAITLESAVDLAISRSAEVQIGELEVAKGRAGERVARAMRLPTISVQGSGSFLSQPSEGVVISKGAFGYAPTAQSPAPVAIPDQDFVIVDDAEPTYFSIRTTLTQPLITWGKLRRSEELARIETDANILERQRHKFDAEQELTDLYLAGRFAQDSVTLLEKVVAVGEAIVADRNRSYDEGLITRQNILEAESDLAGLELQLNRSVEALKTARTALLFFTGLDAGEFYFATPLFDSPGDLDEETLLEAAKERSIDREILYLRSVQARLARRIAAGDRVFKPDISISISLDITGQRIPLVGANWTDSWNSNLIVTIGTQLELFDSGRSKASLEQSEIDLQIATVGGESFDRGIALIVRRQIDAIRTAAYEFAYSQAKLDLALEQERNAEVSFENEIITREKVLLARLGSLLASLELLSKSYAIDRGISSLERVTYIDLRDKQRAE